MASPCCWHGLSVASKSTGCHSYGRLSVLEGGIEGIASGSALRDSPPAQCSGRSGFTGLHAAREECMTARGSSVDLWSFSNGVGRPCVEHSGRAKSVLQGGTPCSSFQRGGGLPARGRRPDGLRALSTVKYGRPDDVEYGSARKGPKNAGVCTHAAPTGPMGGTSGGRRSGRIHLRSSFFTNGPDFGVSRAPLPQRRRDVSSSVAGIELANIEIANSMMAIKNLGFDTLTFLCATVVVVPVFKRLNASPILGFLLSGVVLCQIGAFRNVYDIEALSELGILFLLFEMGLELSLARLKALAKYAFGIGLAQVLLSTLAFTAFELPTGNAVGTQLLEVLVHARNDLVNIRSVDEAIVIGAALAMSSSAFVLQILAEKGELPTKFGSATLGILLLQDIAVVPLLVLLPLLEMGNFDDAQLWPMIGLASLRALGGLGLLLIGGRLLLRRLFEFVADSRSPEAFVALCLLTVTGTSLITSSLGFSDTLGAFLAGVLLAETNYRTQVEADIRPFRGLLLGLFFVTTGTSIDIQLLVKEWPNILALLFGLLAIKTSIITALGPRSGLTLAESLRTGLLLSQGGEFAFVIFSLANQLGILPLELNRLLIIVVVLSMALTPTLYELGKFAANALDARADAQNTEGGRVDYEVVREEEQNLKANEPLVIIGFGNTSQVLANFLETPLASGMGGDSSGWPYIAFDLNPKQVKAARKLGFPVLYGDGSRPAVLQTAGISRPKAVLVMYTGRVKATKAVESIHQAFPGVPVFARAQDLRHLLELKAAGATDVVLETAETGLRLGSMLLQGLGVVGDDVKFLRQVMRESMEQRARELTGDEVEINQFLLPRQLRPFFNKPKPENGAAGEQTERMETLDEMVRKEFHASNGAVSVEEPPPPPSETGKGSPWQAEEPRSVLEAAPNGVAGVGGEDRGGPVASPLKDGAENIAGESAENPAAALPVSIAEGDLVLAAQMRAMRVEQARVVRLRQVAERGMVSRGEAFSATKESSSSFMAVVEASTPAANGGATGKAGVVKVQQRERRRVEFLGSAEGRSNVRVDKRGVLLCRLPAEEILEGDGSDSDWEYEGDDWGMQDPVDSIITSVARREER